MPTSKPSSYLPKSATPHGAEAASLSDDCAHASATEVFTIQIFNASSAAAAPACVSTTPAHEAATPTFKPPTYLPNSTTPHNAEAASLSNDCASTSVSHGP